MLQLEEMFLRYYIPTDMLSNLQSSIRQYCVIRGEWVNVYICYLFSLFFSYPCLDEDKFLILKIWDNNPAKVLFSDFTIRFSF